ncbi:MAG: hypothetical protein LUD27_01085 [Clostridia bacterium]|nr:hypothetical protein [Clostridia bacterium]
MHEGHRQRMYEKLKNGDNLYEHEVLEILLFNAYPRKNTNPIAHALLERFPSTAAVLGADVDELTAVEGVGEQTALYLKCVGECFKLFNKTDCFAIIRNRSDLIDFIKMRLGGHRVEVLELYAIDKNGKIVRIKTFTSNENNKVVAPPDEVMKFISLVKPYSLVIAHNHTCGSLKPSAADDNCTKQVQIVCSMNNVQLKDHIICADTGVYSYYDSGRLNNILDGFSIGKLLKDD